MCFTLDAKAFYTFNVTINLNSNAYTSLLTEVNAGVGAGQL